MASAGTTERGEWGSKLGFVLAAAGSAVGLGNIWRYPSEVAEGGGAAFILIYLACCFLIGFPVMVAEITIGRSTQRNPVGAFKALSSNRFFPLVGLWGVLCGVMILSFYLVLAGWTFGFVFSEIFFFVGNQEAAAWFANIKEGSGPKNALFVCLFIAATIGIVAGGVSAGIERAARIMMPILIVVLIGLIGYVLTLDGAGEGLAVYLKPDFSKIDGNLILAAMSQSFFSLSLGMGALITYGSYMSKRQNVPESAAYVTLADVGIAIIAGLLIIPAMYVAQANGVAIFGEDGALLNSVGLVFEVLPALFHTMNPVGGLVFGVAFFSLLSMAALTSTISLLEVPTSYIIDEHGLTRKQAALAIGSIVGTIGLIIAFNLSLIGTFDTIFSVVGLPLGGFLICIFLGYVWTTERAKDELREGFPGLDGWFGSAWPFFIRYVCPILIGLVFITTLLNLFNG
jgi:NSS family neurotransmitter:Na+ symporter